MNLQKKIKMLREFKNFSQEHMAFELQISQSTYAKIESGKMISKIDRIKEIATILEVDFLSLLDDNVKLSTRSAL